MIHIKKLFIFFFLFLSITSCGRSSESSDVSSADTAQSSEIWWIDTHTHPNTNIVTLNQEGLSHEDFTYCLSEECLSTAIELMNDAEIRFAFMMPPPSAVANQEYETSIAPALGLYSDHFVYVGGGSTLNPMIQKAVAEGTVTDTLRDAFETQAREIIQDGAVGFGEMAVLHLSMSESHPFEEVPADHELFLLLADIAAEHDVPIAIHMDLVVDDMNTPDFFVSHSEKNPETLEENLASFERLLAHNRNAKIVWAHVGSDTTGVLTPDVVRELFEEHSNLYADLRLTGSPTKGHELLSKGFSGTLSEDWRELIEEYPTRFTLGSDAFFGNEKQDNAQSAGTLFLSQLSEETAVQVGCANAVALYNLAVSCQ